MNFFLVRMQQSTETLLFICFVHEKEKPQQYDTFAKLTKFSLTDPMAKNCKSMYEFGSVSISVFVISDGYEAKRGGEKEDLPSMSSLWLYKLWSFRINVKIKFHISGGNFPPEIYISISK